jgi:hypothetical protein
MAVASSGTAVGPAGRPAAGIARTGPAETGRAVKGPAATAVSAASATVVHRRERDPGSIRWRPDGRENSIITSPVAAGDQDKIAGLTGRLSMQV